MLGVLLPNTGSVVRSPRACATWAKRVQCLSEPYAFYIIKYYCKCLVKTRSVISVPRRAHHSVGIAYSAFGAPTAAASIALRAQGVRLISPFLITYNLIVFYK